MGAVLGWYLLVTLIGWAAWPLAFRLLPGLPDRGYAFSRALGLLLIGYVFWLLVTLGFLRNTTGGILFAMLIVLSLGLWAYATRPDKSERITAWLGENAGQLLVAEGLFLLAFAGWALVRAYNPEIAGTEKPMELAFLNGVRNSETFPPHDPWLSGYAISYYYFGYVIVAMLAELSGVATSIAFNLGIALLFALTLLGSYGVIYNLLAARQVASPSEGTRRPSPVLSALLGPLFVGLLGNLEGFFELVRALNLPFIGAGFWRWLDILDINEPAGARLWPPETWRYWWWWRASRVIHDRDAAGLSIGLQPIDEFPFFSFLLGDMHPHVLALPFALLALGLAFNALAQRERLSRTQMALYVLCFGGLAFLNTWDLPIYLFVLIGALAVRRIRERGWFEATDLLKPLGTGFAIGALGLLAYLPWLISFSSQAGGILPNAIFPTRLHQFAVMFGPFLAIIIWYVVEQAIRRRPRTDWSSGLLVGGISLITLIGLTVALSAVALRTSDVVRAFAVASAGFSTEGRSSAEIASLIPQAVQIITQYRLSHPLTPLLLVGLLTAASAVLLARPLVEPEHRSPFGAATGFILLLIVTGALLTLGPEFVYLRDNFGMRLNTIFKFYYATWILWGLAAAYAANRLIAQRTLWHRAVFSTLAALLTLAALVYPILALPAKTGGFVRGPGQPPPTLDGIAYIRQQYPADYAGILWLQQNAAPDAVVLEAVGGAYSYYGRVSSATGLPTVIGWENHERQWRGPLYDELAGTRGQDVHEIYNTPNMLRAQELLAKYGVTYIFVGTLERNPQYASPNGIGKFDRYLTAVYRAEGIAIYRADLPLIAEEQP